MDDSKMKCPTCGAAELVHNIRDTPYTYKGASTILLAIKGDFCPACGEAVLEAKESYRVNTLMRRLQKQASGFNAVA
jgi:HTH-type transcriptional regulator / antitoxin MqsA